MEEAFNALWPPLQTPSPPSGSISSSSSSSKVPGATGEFGSVGKGRSRKTGAFAASFNLTEEVWIDNSSPANAKVLASAWR